jgi:hypothetical protein
MRKMSNPSGRGAMLVPIATALIGVVGTVAVAWIGIVPKLREGDQARIEQLIEDRRQDLARIDDLKSALDRIEARVGDDVPAETWRIRGKITRQELPVRNAFVALLPMDNADRLQSSDSQGVFQFSDVVPGSYLLLISASDTPLTERGVIDAFDRTSSGLDLTSSNVAYQVSRD